MQFILDAFCQLEGLGAASGLVYRHPQLYLISDYSSYLYRYNLPENQLDKIALFADSREFIAKPEKFDFEAIVEYDHALLLFGSGSTPRRNTLVRYDLTAASGVGQATKAEQYDLSLLYQTLRQTAQLNHDELNIEGVIQHQAEWLFFQRGNGVQAQHGIFVVQGDIFKQADLQADSLGQPRAQHHTADSSLRVQFVPVQLPVVDQVSSGFTDAVLVENTIYFLASAENSSSTYTDGEVLGSFIGRMDLKNRTIQEVQLISTRHKFEGLSLYQQSAETIEFLLCEDNDTEQLSSTLYKLSLLLS